MKYILGIDIGTGSTKAVAVDLKYNAFDSSQCFYQTQSPHQGYSEQHPELIWQAFRESISSIVEKLGSAPITISLSSAMHSLIAVDNNGEALIPMMTWADQRSAAIAERLLSDDTGLELYKETGTPIHPMSPLCKIIWIRENQPEIFEKAAKFISIKEYIWHRLFKHFEADHSIASCTGLMDVQQMKWSKKALACAGIGEERLSVLCGTSYSRKDFDPEVLPFLEAGTPFVIGASDGCLANLGSGAFRPGLAALTIGTSGALRVASDKAVLSIKGMTFSYHLDESIFINGGAVNNGGVALKWHLKNLLGKETLSAEDYDTALRAAESVKAGADGLIFLPYLQGERAPIWDSKSCGNFFGINLNHHQQHFTRAVVEGICFALNDVLLSLTESGQPVAELKVSGGFVSSPVWLQIMANITGKKLIKVNTEDASATGAAYLAVKAIGLEEDYPSPHHEEMVFVEPDGQEHEIYKKYFKIYKKLYQNLKGTMHELHDLQNEVI